MSTWELYSDSSGDGFRWEVSGRILQSDSDSTPTKGLESTALPSMSDLLLQGCSRLVEQEEAMSGDVPLFRTGLGKSVSLKESSIARAKSILGDDKVDYSVQHHSGTPGQYEDHGKRSEIVNQSFKVPPTMFQTAGGKSLSVSAEALKRAKNLLGDPELGTLFDDIAADDQFFITPKDKRFDDIGINDESCNTSKIHKSNSFVSPLRSSSKQFRSVKLGNLHSGSNLIKKFDAAVVETDCTLNITKLAARGLSNNGSLASDRVVNNSKENGFFPRAKQLGRQADQPLVDITNCSDIAFANSKQDCIQKKRLGKGVSVAPFKRPRISSFKTPLKNNAQQAASGKEVGVPLDFNCIKCSGGPVPETLAGITRIYPILYKERLGEKKSIVRSEKMESRVNQLHTQRRLALVEGLMSEYDKGINGIHSQDDTDSEGAKVFKLLETAAEPELLAADMSMEQLKSYSTYKAKFEASMQIQMEKSVTKALEDAGLGERNVTPFMRIRLVGVTSLSYEGEHKAKEGIVTIWDPTESQITELTEGKIYLIQGLVSMNSDSEILYLHARSSSSRWQPLSAEASASFQPFFNPRKPISLSNIGEIPLSSEFDIAAYVVHVGDAYTNVQQTKQWVFVADGSTQVSHSGKISHSLLAISFCTTSMDDISTPIINHNLVGSMVGFCNVIKKAKDVQNEMWVGEATENTEYFINTEAAYPSHLKSNSSHIQTLAKLSSSNSVIHELRQKVLSIIGAR